MRKFLGCCLAIMTLTAGSPLSLFADSGHPAPMVLDEAFPGNLLRVKTTLEELIDEADVVATLLVVEAAQGIHTASTAYRYRVRCQPTKVWKGRLFHGVVEYKFSSAQAAPAPRSSVLEQDEQLIVFLTENRRPNGLSDYYSLGVFRSTADLANEIEARLPSERHEGLDQEVARVLSHEYTEAILVRDGVGKDIWSFSANTREFITYTPTKTGDWQEPQEVTAPDRSGIVVRFYVRKGQWHGALKAPYSGTIDRYLFVETRVIKNSSDGTRHLWAEILTPRTDAPRELLSRLVKVFENFEAY